MNNRFLSGKASRSSPLWRIFYTLRYHHLSQLWMRLRKRTWNRIMPPTCSATPQSVAIRDECRNVFASILHRRLPGRHPFIKQDPTANQRGELTFLNQTVPLGHSQSDEWCWDQVNELDVDHLWRFHLHYHEFLFDSLPGKEGYQDCLHQQIWTIVQSWIDTYPMPTRGNSDELGIPSVSPEEFLSGPCCGTSRHHQTKFIN